ncbi:MAG TPA: hypothetical protein VF912_20985 [Anaeromyxobacter sp.]
MTAPGSVLGKRDEDFLQWSVLAQLASIEHMRSAGYRDRHGTVALRRFEKLKNPGGSQRGYLHEPYAGLGQKVVALTAEGYARAASRLGWLKVPKFRERPVPPAEVQHRLKLNDVLFGIVGRLVDANARKAGSRDRLDYSNVSVSPNDVPMRWLPEEGDGFAFAIRRRVRPDAIAEFPSLALRAFIEQDMGNHPVDGADRGRSLMGTLQDYGRFIFDVIDGDGRTAYQKAFSDHWSADVVYVFENALRRENTRKAFAAQLPDLAASGRFHMFIPDEAIAHFVDSIARSRRMAASTSRSSDRPRTPSAIARARKAPATPEPSITVGLEELRSFFNFDIELEKAFKGIQRKVQAGEPITEVPQLPADYERVREFKRQLRARIVALMEDASRTPREVAPDRVRDGGGRAGPT